MIVGHERVIIVNIKEQIEIYLTKENKSRNWLAAAARDAGICTRATVYNWLGGKHDIGNDTAEAILALIKKPPAEL